MADDFEERTSALVVLLPQEGDPAAAASSEDIPHITFVWMGEPGEDFEADAIAAEVERYAAGTTPITVPVKERGVLGDEDADVLFLEPTESLTALRDGLMAESEALTTAHDDAEQYPEWTPHVTLGYPEAPAVADYDGDQITFDRFALWIGNERTEYPMGTTKAVAASAAVVDEVEGTDVVPDDIDMDDEDLVDDIPDEVPVHGVAAIEGKPTGDGRGFRTGAFQIPEMPVPMGFEFESSHGGGNSRVAIVGRIDEMWKVDVEGGVTELRYRGVIIPSKDYANQAIDGIVDGTFTGVSVKIDDVTVDVAEEKEAMKERLRRERDGEGDEVPEGEEPEASSAKATVLSDEQIEALVEDWMGDGTTQVTWVSSARPRNFDIVHFPAFVEGYIDLGGAFEDELTDEDRAALVACGCYQPADGDDDDVIRGEDAAELAAIAASGSFAPGTKDGPGWITHPRATARIRRYWTHGKGAAKIRWGQPGDFNRCRKQLAKYVANPDWLAGLCANMHYEVLKRWPGPGKNRGHSAEQVAGQPLFGLVASASWRDDDAPYPASWFSEKELGKPTQMVITPEGEVYGHLALWNSCHIGMDGLCFNPTPSTTGYEYFHIGVVDTDDGPVKVGHLTYGIGHTSLHATAAQATAHYDQPSATRAHVRIYEDAFGIAFHGALREGLTAAEVREFKANGALSGDWRWVTQHQMELVGATSVNTPGFGIPAIAASGGRQTALLSVPLVIEDDQPAGPTVGGSFSAEELAGIARAAAREVLAEEARRRRLAALEPVRAAARSERLARIRAAATQEG